MAKSDTKKIPSMSELIDFITENSGKVGKKEIAREFNIKGDDRIKLKEMLKEIKASGSIGITLGNKLIAGDSLPHQCPSEITGEDSDGNLIARPLVHTKSTGIPQIIITDLGKLKVNPVLGDTVLLRLTPAGKNRYHGEILKKLANNPGQIVALFESTSGKGGHLVGVERKMTTRYEVDAQDTMGAKNQDIVVAQILGSVFSQYEERKAKIVKVVGKSTDPAAASLIAIAMHNIPTEFPLDAVKQAQKAKPVSLGNREDIRNIPLVTIDGEDARDFDDAIFAKKDENGWHLIVAIADVSYYVTPFSPLDNEARLRGNSVYFPDRCIPMLPAELSSELCSLKPNEDRACIACHLYLDKTGKLRKSKFTRALMRSYARLNYHEVQNVYDGKMPEMEDNLRTAILNLKSVYELLKVQRKNRNALEINAIENEIFLNDNYKITSIKPRERLDSHKTVEEFMILANVAAAKTLEAKEMPTLYRVHEPPSPEKQKALIEALLTMNIRLKKLSQEAFNNLMRQAAGTPREYLINDLILRAQSQARYCPENLSHYGLSLEKYVHFTSPIRRYSDLIVHRGLISALSLGNDGLTDEDNHILYDLEDVGQHISATERRAASAELDAESRYLAYYLAGRTGEVFSGIISGASAHGLFVVLDDIGAQGFIPISSIPYDLFEFDEKAHRLVGAETKKVYQLGQPINVILTEVRPIKGGLLFEIVQDKHSSKKEKRKKQKFKKHFNKNHNDSFKNEYRQSNSYKRN
ncbi:MAG: ribonuclease R [Alphaproteobacteria bacterium]|nr:ribonuclease R [Alphaproteobacteria bacterium]